MINGDHHMLCAFALWEAQMRAKQLELEIAALKLELERLKPKADKKVKNAN